ncbi:Fic family protein [Candidatus Micrarchaeota archaeon]|nr:Fic family protein [Candidatus Micrarchaeota archaeon]
MRIRKKGVNGKEYYYLEETLRLEKPKAYSIFLGAKKPGKRQLEAFRRKLIDKIYDDLLWKRGRVYLSKEQLIEAEKRRRRYTARVKRLGRAARDEKDETDTVNFVYTTLTTEGVPITKEDASLAYRFTQKNVKSLRDESLRVALDMIKGLRFVKESKTGISMDFFLNLHEIIMAEYGETGPGSIRDVPAFIYLKSLEKVEEIGFRPSPPDMIRKKLEELVVWYNANIGKLNAIEFASLLHLRFYMIHPFKDGNKRISRLLLNKAFLDSGYPMLNISKQSMDYFDALIRSVERKAERPFVEFVYARFIQDI